MSLLERRPTDPLPPFYARYVARVPDGDVLTTLERQLPSTSRVLLAFAPRREEHRYAAGKWTVRQVAGHVADAERVFSLRMLWFGRGAAADQPGFDEDRWAAASNAGSRSLADHAGELERVRASTLALLQGMDEEALGRRGTANGMVFTAATLAWIVAGHELHHRAVLQERYARGAEA